MKWTIHQLNQMPKKDFEFDETVDLSELSQSSEIRSISPVRVKGRAEFRSKQAAFDFTISGEMILPCSRTLVDVRYPFSISTKELFIFHKTEELEDEDVHIVEDDLIDLTPVVKEEILLEIPMQIFVSLFKKKKVLRRRARIGRSLQKMTGKPDRSETCRTREALKQDDES